MRELRLTLRKYNHERTIKLKQAFLRRQIQEFHKNTSLHRRGPEADKKEKSSTVLTLSFGMRYVTYWEQVLD